MALVGIVGIVAAIAGIAYANRTSERLRNGVDVDVGDDGNGELCHSIEFALRHSSCS